MRELVAALFANDPDAFRGLLSEDMQEPGVIDVEELLAGLVLGGESFTFRGIRHRKVSSKTFGIREASSRWGDCGILG